MNPKISDSFLEVKKNQKKTYNHLDDIKNNGKDLFIKNSNNKEKKNFDKKRVNNRIDFPEMDQITDTIFLGNYEAAKSKEMLRARGITHILTIGTEMKPLYKDDFYYLIIPVKDSQDEDIYQHFLECFEFIEKSIKVFIHCRLGISRSATITIAYLMWKFKLDLKVCLKHVFNKRNKINPNDNFFNQLKILEDRIKTKTFK